MDAHDPRVVRALIANANVNMEAHELADFAQLGDGDIGAGVDAFFWCARGHMANAARAGAGLSRPRSYGTVQLLSPIGEELEGAAARRHE